LILEPTTVMPRASIDCQLTGVVLAVQLGGGVDRSPGLTLHAVADAEVHSVQGDRAGDAVKSQPSRHRPVAAAAVCKAVAVELERRVVRDIEEVGGTQMVVAHPHAGVDRRGFHDDMHRRALHRLRDTDGAGEVAETTVDTGETDVAGDKTDPGMRRFDLPVARLGQRRRRGYLVLQPVLLR
jgi:hypothetical protein